MTRAFLFATISISGAATLLLEVTATRLLAPYFGNSIYVLASVLAVVLGCLSLGYWLGGNLAERRNPRHVLFGAIAAAGLGGFLTSLLMATVMPAIGLALPFTWGPLVTSVLLFSLPSTFLGMVTPAAVRLHPDATRLPGRASGEVLAVSTIGSIGGSILGGFLLVPFLGLRWTILATAGALVVLGVLGLGGPERFLKKRAGIGALLLIVPALALPWTWFLGSFLVHEQSTAYQHVLIADRPDPERGGRVTRYLIADHALMSGEDRETGEPVFAYLRGTLDLIDALPRDPARVAVLGGAAFTLPRALHARYPEATVDAVDIDPALPTTAKTFFHLRPDERLRIHVTDGRRFIRQTEDTYDVIVLDMYQSLSIPTHTLTEEFFKLLAARLAPGGVVIANIIGLPPALGPSLPVAVARSASASFPHQSLFAMPSQETVGNFLVVLSRGESALHERAGVGDGVRAALAPEAMAAAPAFHDDRANTIWYDTAHARALR